MKKLFSALLAVVCLTGLLALPASASARSSIAEKKTVSLADEIQAYTAPCTQCEIGLVRYHSTVTGPWLRSGYVDCLSGDPQYRDSAYTRDVTHYYLCDNCKNGFSEHTQETKTEHKHGW